MAAAIARDLVAWVAPDPSVSWEDLLPLQEPAPPPGRLPRGVLHLLMQIGQLYKQHETTLRKRTGEQSLAEIDALIHKGRWSWMATYNLSRLAGRTPEVRSFVTDLQTALCSGRSIPASEVTLPDLQCWVVMLKGPLGHY